MAKEPIHVAISLGGVPLMVDEINVNGDRVLITAGDVLVVMHLADAPADDEDTVQAEDPHFDVDQHPGNRRSPAARDIQDPMNLRWWLKDL